jgi:ribonuclease R
MTARRRRVRLVEQRGKQRQQALRVGDRVLARTEEAGKGWIAHPMKKLPAQTDQMLGVVEIDGAGKGWLAPVDKRVRHAVPISDLGQAEVGQLVLAEPAGRSPAGLSDDGAGRSAGPARVQPDRHPQARHPVRVQRKAIEEAKLAAALPLSEDHREDLRHLPIVAIDPVDARDHDDAIWAEPDGEGGFARWSPSPTSASTSARVARWTGTRASGAIGLFPRPRRADAARSAERGCLLAQGRRGPRGDGVPHDHRCAGAVTSWRFTRARVRIAEVIAYEEAQRRIDASEAAPHLAHLWGAWRLLEKARKDRDPLELDLPERRVLLDEQGRSPKWRCANGSTRIAWSRIS